MSDADASGAASGDAVTARRPPPTTPEDPWPVATLAGKIKGWIDRLGTVWVEGELAQWNLRQGSAFGKLKDLERDVTVSLTAWSSTLARTDAEFAQGDRVIALVKPDYFAKSGSLTMQVYAIRHVGLGDLLERIERLRRTLAAEGLFALERKQRLPFLPHCIGLITGKDSDAEKDVVQNARLRWPEVRFRIRHAIVQGDRAARDIAGAVANLDADPEVDVIVIARGGGDFQNLLPFSDEGLVRAVAACRTPVVSAIGHENDRPLLDEVADLRASTPTDAAKRIVPDIAEELLRVRQARARLDGRVTALVATQIDALAALRSRPVLADPGRMIRERTEELTRWVLRGSELMDHRLERASAAVGELAGQLRALSPRRTLDRGYAIARTDAGHALRDPAEAPSGTRLLLTLAEGELSTVSSGPAEPPAPRG